ncbi:MAG: hypothetical protein KJN63_10600 [Acidimicrobiia bacterium]|nr:hypothetical protein [Acidimicrobiia bacterium]
MPYATAQQLPSAGKNGVYELAAYPDCFRPYSGKRRAESLFVVGLGTDKERLFARRDNKAAIAYAKETKERLIQLHVTQVCYEAVAVLFGEEPL